MLANECLKGMQIILNPIYSKTKYYFLSLKNSLCLLSSQNFLLSSFFSKSSRLDVDLWLWWCDGTTSPHHRFSPLMVALRLSLWWFFGSVFILFRSGSRSRCLPHSFHCNATWVFIYYRISNRPFIVPDVGFRKLF